MLMGIIYDYQDYGHNQLIVTVPNENFTSVNSINLGITVTNKNITEDGWNWAPYKQCSGDDCIILSLTVGDNYGSHLLPENSFDRTQQSKIQVDLSGAGWVEIIIGTQSGDTQNLFKVVMHNAQSELITALLLNTTEFSIVYPAKLSVSDLNYDISKKDWF